MPAADPTMGARRRAALEALEGVERVPGSSKPDPIVVADGVQRRFGGLVAVDVDHVEIQRGAITALIGFLQAVTTVLDSLPNWPWVGGVLYGLHAAIVALTHYTKIGNVNEE